jgi:hypothetical protein
MRRMCVARVAVLGLALSLGLGCPQPGWAATAGGATLPDTYPVTGQTLVLNGLGVRALTIFNVKVYAAGLYLAQRSGDARAIMASPGPKVILLHFLHAASKSDIEKHYREGEQHNCGNGGCAPADAADFERLITVTPAAAVGDTLTYVLSPKGVRALFNNRQIGEFTNPDLALRLLAGFIGDVPPSEDLKRHLLGAP